jgi:hypothetical protein
MASNIGLKRNVCEADAEGLEIHHQPSRLREGFARMRVINHGPTIHPLTKRRRRAPQYSSRQDVHPPYAVMSGFRDLSTESGHGWKALLISGV